jgi:hypothetical protein
LVGGQASSLYHVNTLKRGGSDDQLHLVLLLMFTLDIVGPPSGK